MTGPSRCAAMALAAALLLAAPLAGRAQGKSRTPAPAAPAPAARSAPPALPGPEPAAATAVEPGAWRGGLSLGYEKETGSDFGGPRVHVELERALIPLGSRVQLSIVAAAAWFHGTDSDTLNFGGPTLTIETTGELLEVVPSFRFGVALNPRARLFAEVGVGGAWAKGTVETSTSLAPGVVNEVSDETFAGVVRFSAGGAYRVNPRFEVGLLLPTYTRRYGEATSKTLSFSAMAIVAF